MKTNLKLKLNKNQVRTKLKPKLDVRKLKWEVIRRRYNVEVRNRFKALDIDVTEHAEGIEKAYVKAAEKVLGFVKNRRKLWIGGETLQKIEVRKAVKNRLESTRSERVKVAEHSF